MALSFFCSTSLFVEARSYSFPSGYCFYPQPKNITHDMWKRVFPFLIPYNHPAKAKLDRIFSKGRPTANKEAFLAAGFKPLCDQGCVVNVARHALIPGYIVKVFFDDFDLNERRKFPDESYYLSNRVIGAERVRQSIHKHHFEDVATVANKWIYLLPESNCPQTSENTFPKHFILVVEELDIVSHAENIKWYKEKMTKRHLDALYTIMSEAHLFDSVYIDNNVFTRSGKIAFIDTEEFDFKPVKFERITQFLSPEMQVYWEKLLKERGALIPATAPDISKHPS